MTSNEPTLQHRIVTGIDGSKSSNEALGSAARQAHLAGATLEVVTTWDWPPNLGWGVPIPEDCDPAADAKGCWKAPSSRYGRRIPTSASRPRRPRAVPPVLVAASRDADLLVVGGRPRRVAGMLLGSVSEHCVNHAHCAVTVVRDRP